MIDAPAGYYWEVHLGRFETTVVLLKARDPNASWGPILPIKVAMDSFAGTFTDEAMVEAVERTAKRILARFAGASLLAEALGVEVLVK